MDGFSAYSGTERRINTAFVYWGPERRSFWNNIRPDERTLIERAVRHDRAAFARLFDRFVDSIYKYLYSVVGNPSDAEDLTAQVFLKAWEGIGQYHWTDRPFLAWLFRIANHIAIDYNRAQPDLSAPEYSAHSADQRTSSGQTASPDLDLNTLRQELARLTPDLQQVIVLRFLERYNTEQVAQLMGKQPGAIRKLQHRALAVLSGAFRRGQGNL